MKILQVETLISQGAFAQSEEWREIRESFHSAIQRMDHPAGTEKFTLYAQSGKKRGEGNGVKPIKNSLMNYLEVSGWKLEEPLDIATRTRPGNLDAVLYTSFGPVAVEWETGNISSSHRALNKMALGLLKGILVSGTLVVPSRDMYRYLTDRVGNFPELEPYLDLWRSIPCCEGVFEIVVIEHDAVSTDVPRIPKGISGRALQ